MFFAGSRYETTPEATHVDAQGRERRYKRLRRLTSPPAQRTHVVTREDRLDRLAFSLYADPEQFWRIADANDGMLPEELTEELGRRLLIPLL
jgi:nucleoid-associated protein YgaU